MNGLMKNMRALISFVLTFAILLSFSLGSEYSLIRSFAADEDLQFYDDDGSIAINLEDDGSDLGTIWFDGENFYDSDPADQIGIEYPSAEWQAEKDIDGTDMTVTATIPAGAFDRRVGFYAKVTTIDSLSADKVALLDKNELPKETLEFFDIGFKDKEGNEIEPSMAIEITFRLKERASKAKENGDSLLIDVYHITKEEGVELEKVASINEQVDENSAKNTAESSSSNTSDSKTSEENPITSADVGGIIVEDGDVVATFEADSFSTYAIHDSSSNRIITFDTNETYLNLTKGTITGTMAAQTITKGTIAVLNKNAFVYSGHLFRGWSNVPNPKDSSTFPKGITTAETYSDGGTINVSAHTTLYAQWDDHDHTGWTELNGTIDPTTLTSAGNYYLNGDVIFTATWNVPVGETTLCLNGYKLTNTSDNLINVRSGATFNLEDCNGSRKNGHNETYAVTNPITSSTVNIETGLLTSKGGAIELKGGTFNMYGGTIAGLNYSKDGLAIFIPQGYGSSEVNIYDGTIAYNSTTGGSNIRAFSGIFNLYGGKIMYNEALFGGGLCISYNSNFNMTGGEISGNVATRENYIEMGGGGINFGAGFDGTASITGGLIINNKDASQAGGISIATKADRSASITIGGSTIISGNTTTGGNAGGIGNAYNRSFNIEGSPQITGNTVNGIIQNVYVRSGYPLQVVGTLGENANVGITMDTPGVFTSGYGYLVTSGYNYAVNPTKYFSSDNINYSVILDENGEAQIGAGHIHPLNNSSGDEITFTPWTATDSLPTTAGSFYLANDVTLSSTWTVPEGTTNLCLNGHVIRAAGGFRSISVPSGRTLNLTDCDGDTTHTITSAADSQSKTIIGGLITGENGGINVYGTLNMYGGNICGINSGGSDGAGIYVSGGTLYLDNTNIAYNKARNGGGIAIINGANFTMDSGNIEYNTCTDGGYQYAHGGGGVHVYSSTMTMNGGSISYNSSSQTGGGLIVTINSTFIMNGGKISENKCNRYSGGAIWTGDDTQYGNPNAKSILTINGGEITDNTAYTLGGALSITRYCELELNGGVISGNHSLSSDGVYGGAVQIDGNSKISLSNNPKVINNYGYNNMTANIYLNSTRKITITGQLSNSESGPQIGITMVEPGVFTTDYGYKNSGYNAGVKPSVYFFSDDTNYSVTKTFYGEAQLGDAHVHPLNMDGTGDDITFEKWTETTSLPTTAGSYYLTADVTLSSTWTVPSGTVNLCLDGHVIKGNGHAAVISINKSDTVLNITDCNSEDVTHSNISSKVSWTESTVSISGGVITGGSGTDGGGISVGNGVLNFYAGSVVGNSAEHGGAICINDNGTGNIYGGTFAYNNVSYGGGGLTAHGNTGGTLNIYDCDVHDNYAWYGGGVFCRQNGTLNIYDGKIYKNRCGVKDNGGGAGLCYGATFVGNSYVDKVKIYENTSDCHGGGIATNSATGTVILADVTVTNNIANGVYTYTGGGIGFFVMCGFSIKGTPVIKGNKVNNVENNVYLRTGQLLTVAGKFNSGANIGISMQTPGIFTTGYGFSSGYNDKVDPAVYFSSDDSPVHSVLLYNKAEGMLGTYSHVHCMHDEYSKDDVTFTRWYRTDSLPTEPGNYFLDYDVVLTSAWTCNKNIKLCLNGHQITSTINGRFITVNGETLNICDCYKESTHSGDEYSHTIKNYYKDKGETVTIKGGLIGGSDSTSNPSRGLIMSRGTLNLYGGTIAGNKVNDGRGGGGFYQDGGTINIYDGEYKYNYADHGGGFIRSGGGSINVYDGEIEYNTGRFGGGISITSGAAFDIRGGKINYNSCYSDQDQQGGGAINMGTGTGSSVSSISGGEIIGNEATSAGAYGGGIQVCSGILNITGGTISDNTAISGGGGIACYTDADSQAADIAVNITSAVLNGNKATNGNGGALYVGSGFNKDKSLKVTVNSNTSITGNTATLGGGVYITKGTRTDSNDVEFSMTGGTISSNNAATNGGGIYLNTGVFNLTGGTITANTSSSDSGLGLGIYVADVRDGSKNLYPTKLNMLGNPVISGNETTRTVSGASVNYKDNVYLAVPSDILTNSAAYPKNAGGMPITNNINLTGALTSGASIGVRKTEFSSASPMIRFTTGYGYSDSSKANEDGTASTQFNMTVNPGKYFSSDDAKYSVTLYKDGCEAMLSSYMVEYHAPKTIASIDEFKSGNAIWNDTDKRTLETSPYLYVPSDIADVETFYAEEYPSSSSSEPIKAHQPKDPAWNPNSTSKMVFTGWYLYDGNASTEDKEYVFANTYTSVTEPIILNATWEAYLNEQSYAGGLIGYAEGDVKFSGCQVGYNPDGAQDVGILLRSTGFDGYVGGFIGYTDGKLTVDGADTKAMSRLYGTYVGGVGGYAKGKVDVSSAEVSGYILGMDEDAQPSIVAVDGFIPYRTYAGVYVVRKEDDTAFGHDSFPSTEQQFKFYDKEVFGTALPDDIMKVVRPKHRFYQNNAGSQWTDPLTNVGVTAVSQP